MGELVGLNVGEVFVTVNGGEKMAQKWKRLENNEYVLIEGRASRRQKIHNVVKVEKLSYHDLIANKGYSEIKIWLSLTYVPFGGVGVDTPPRDGTAVSIASANWPLVTRVASLDWMSACVTPSAGMTENKTEIITSAPTRLLDFR